MPGKKRTPKKTSPVILFKAEEPQSEDDFDPDIDFEDYKDYQERLLFSRP